MERYEPPIFAVYEVTSNRFFDGSSIVEKTFGDVRAEVTRLTPLRNVVLGTAAE